MEWHIIPTGRVWVDPGGPFGLVPQPLWRKHQTPDEHGRVPMDLNCLLIQTEGQRILVDCGLGDKLSPKAQRNWGIEWPHGTLRENLAKLGVAPQDVDLVIDTHLHSDHCGGNTTLIEGQPRPTFPNAEYLVQRVEWADAMHPDLRTRNTYLPENYRPVWQAGQFRFLHGDTKIVNGVRCVVTPGHTRGHQVVIVETAKAPVLFVADLASYAVHMERAAWVTAYDIAPLENITTKQRWQAWALEHQALLVFEHDTTLRLGKLEKDDDGRLNVRPVHEHPALALFG